MDKEELISLVKEESKKLAIKKILDEGKRDSILDRLKHPLLSVFVGFLLTGVVGSWMTNYYQEQDKKVQLQREAHNHIRQFSESLESRRTEAAYLRSGLIRGLDKETLIKRKDAYDHSVVEWNKNILGDLLTFREYSESRSRIFIEESIEKELVPIFRIIDNCLTEEFDYKLKNPDFILEDKIDCWVLVNEEERLVELKELLDSVKKCGYEISGVMFSYVAINLKSSDDAWKNAKDKVKEVIAGICAPPLRDKELSALKPDYKTAVAI